MGAANPGRAKINPLGLFRSHTFERRRGFSSRGTIDFTTGFSITREMQLSPFIVLLLFLVVYSPIVALGDQLSPKECENLGFTGLALCSDCNTFAQYVKDEELVSDCRKCCSDDTNDSSSKVSYSGAILEVCMRKLVFYPDVAAFIEEEKDQFPSVKVQYVYASPPKLVMLDEYGNHVETIRIDNWKREHILQFLKEKVKKVSLKDN